MSELKPCFDCNDTGKHVNKDAIGVYCACTLGMMEFYKDRTQLASAIESAALRRVASNSRLPHGGDRLCFEQPQDTHKAYPSLSAAFSLTSF